MKKVKGYHIQNPVDLIVALCDKQPDLAEHFLNRYFGDVKTLELCTVSVEIFNFVYRRMPLFETLERIEASKSMRLVVFSWGQGTPKDVRKHAVKACREGYLTVLRGLVAYFNVDLSLKTYKFFKRADNNDIRLFLLRWRGRDGKRVHVTDADITAFFKDEWDRPSVELVRRMTALLEERPGVEYDKYAVSRGAASHGRLDVLKFIRKSPMFHISKSAIDGAIEWDRPSVIEFLTRKMPQKRLQEALMLAIKRKRTKIIQKLLDVPRIDPTTFNFEAVAAILTYGDAALREAVFRNPLVRQKLKL